MQLENDDERLASTKGTTNFSQSNNTAAESFKMSGVTANQSVRQSIQVMMSDKIQANFNIGGHNHSASQSNIDPSWMTSVKKQ